MLYDLLEDSPAAGDGGDVGVSGFDQIDLPLRRWCLLSVLDALTNDDPPPELCAWREATVMAVFELVRGLAADEEELGKRLTKRGERPTRADRLWHGLIRAAWKDLLERLRSAGGIPPELRTESDLDVLIEALADEILWDRDFEEDGEIADLGPRQASALKEFLGIGSSYFTQTPEWPSPVEQERLAQALRRLDAEEQ